MMFDAEGARFLQGAAPPESGRLGRPARKHAHLIAVVAMGLSGCAENRSQTDRTVVVKPVLSTAPAPLASMEIEAGTSSTRATADAGNSSSSTQPEPPEATVLDGEPCSSGTLLGIVACRRRESGSQRVRDVTGKKLAALGWRLLVSDQESQPMNDTSGVPGYVWLYRASAPDGVLKFAHLLTKLGETSKYQHDASFEVVSVRERVIAGKPALWLEWHQREKARLYIVDQYAQWDETHVTSCASVACCVTLTTTRRERRWPAGPDGPEPWAASAVFDVQPATNVREFAIDVTLVKASNMFDTAGSFSTFSSQYNIGRNGCPATD